MVKNASEIIEPKNKMNPTMNATMDGDDSCDEKRISVQLKWVI